MTTNEIAVLGVGCTNGGNSREVIRRYWRRGG